MIDYLELLLDEQEQEELRENPVEMKPVFFSPNGRRAANLTSAQAMQESGLISEEEEHAPKDSVVLSAAWPNQYSPEYLPEAASHTAAYPQAEGVLSVALRRQESPLSPSRPHSWAAGLYKESLTAAQAAVSLRHGGSRMLSASESAAPTAGLTATRLDEMFARDARRYDNGFSMY